MSIDSVMRKIAKLKKLYEGAKAINSEGEAAKAAAILQKLLTEYNLTLDEVGTDEEKAQNNMLHEFISGFTFKSIGGYWEQRLTTVLCNWNFCKCYQYGGTYKKLLIVGKKDNIEMVKWLLDVLKQRFVDFSKDRYKEHVKEYKENGETPYNKDKFQRSYLMGCAEGLDAKLRAEHKREKEEEQELSAKITSLVVRNTQAIEEYVKNQWGQTGSARTYHINNDDARATGYSDGRNTNINKPIAGGRAAASSVRLLGHK